MAGKANVLKQLFIQIGLIGAKTAIKDLTKVEKQTDKAGASAKKAVGKTNALSDGLKKAGISADKTSKKFEKFKGAIGGIVKGIKIVLWPLRMLVKGIAKVGSSILRVIEIAAGIQLSNLVSRAAQGIRGFVSSSIGLAEEEETVRETLRQSFRVQGKGGFVDKFLKIISRISREFGTDATKLAKAFQGTVIPIGKLARVAEVVAKFGIIRPDKDSGIIQRQIGQLLSAGSLEETLKDLAPQLRALKEDERISRGLEVLEKQLKNVTVQDNKTKGFVERQLKARTAELKRTFGRPIVKVLGEIFGELLASNTRASLTDTGTAIAKVIRTFWTAIGGSDLEPIFNKVDKFLSGAIRWIGVLSKDIFDFFTGAPSALQQVFFPDMDPKDIGFGDIAGRLGQALSDVVKEATGGFIELDKVAGAIFGFFEATKKFFIDVVKGLVDIKDSIQNFSIFGGGVKTAGAGGSGEKPTEEGKGFWDTVVDFGKGALKNFSDNIGDFGKGGMIPLPEENEANPIDGIRRRLEDFQRRGSKGNKERLDDSLERNFPTDGNPDPNDQGAVNNFNTNIKITTQQPANVVRNQLANQMALIGNQGRLA